MKIPIVENVLKLNDEIAAINRRTFQAAGVFVIDLIGAPGCGKTSLLENTLRQLAGKLRIGVMVGDLTTSRDAQRLSSWSDQIVQINTGKGCHLDANQVRQAMTEMNLDDLDLLVIENVGNLICPVGFDLGQHVKVGMFSISEGDDKAAKHPYLVHEANLILLNKMDLLPHVPFDMDRFCTDIRAINYDVPLIKLCALKNETEAWLQWLEQQVHAKNGCTLNALQVS